MARQSDEAIRTRFRPRTDRLNHWYGNLISKFVKQEDDGIQTEVHEGLIRETDTDRAREAQAQTYAEDNSGNQNDMG